MVMMEFNDFCIRHVFRNFCRHLHQKHSAQGEIRSHKAVGTGFGNDGRKLLPLLSGKAGGADHHIHSIFKDELRIFINDLRAGEIHHHVRLLDFESLCQGWCNGNAVMTAAYDLTQVLSCSAGIHSAGHLQSFFSHHRANYFTAHASGCAVY